MSSAVKPVTGSTKVTVYVMDLPSLVLAEPVGLNKVGRSESSVKVIETEPSVPATDPL
jgi:hypothetical protein